MFGLFGKKKSATIKPSDLDQTKVAKMGNEADELSERGEHDKAIEKYQAVISLMKESGVVDGYFVGKAVLGVLLGYVRKGDIEGGFAVWTKQDKSLEALGIMMLEHESQQFHGNDSSLYALVSSYYHAWARSENSLPAIHRLLNDVSHYIRQGDQRLKNVIATHWYINMMILSHFQLPEKARNLMDQINQDFPAADEKAIDSLVKVLGNDGSYSFNQKGLAKYFLRQETWEVATEEFAAVIKPTA